MATLAVNGGRESRWLWHCASHADGAAFRRMMSIQFAHVSAGVVPGRFGLLYGLNKLTEIWTLARSILLY